MPTPARELISFSADREIAERFEEICHAKHVEVPDAMRMMLTKAVRLRSFDWLPLDGSEPDKGYMPYVLIKEMLEGASWKPPDKHGRGRGRPRTT